MQLLYFAYKIKMEKKVWFNLFKVWFIHLWCDAFIENSIHTNLKKKKKKESLLLWQNHNDSIFTLLKLGTDKWGAGVIFKGSFPLFFPLQVSEFFFHKHMDT